MGWGKRAHALSSAVTAARVAVAPRPDPRVAAELSRTLTARATASCWVALVIIPFTIVAYDGAYFPEKLPQGIVAAAAPTRSSCCSSSGCGGAPSTTIPGCRSHCSPA